MILYGHRGAKGEAPENTLPGFAYAYGIGVRAFELDVRLSADGELVVIHDATIDRTTKQKGTVAHFTRDELRGMDARADFSEWPEPCFVPTLAEVFDTVPTLARFELEIKKDHPERIEALAEKLIALIVQYDAAERVTLSSFDVFALEMARQIAPDLPRAYIGAYNTPEFLTTALRLECVQADIPVTTGSLAVVREAQANGLRVTGWPGNTREQLETLAAWEVEAITTDFPTLALSLYGTGSSSSATDFSSLG